MGRRYPEQPVLGVGAAMLSGGQVLLVKRGSPPSQGLWSLPGGAVEVGVFERLLKDDQGRLEYH